MAVRNLLAIKSQVAPQNEFKVVDTDGNITINLGSDLVDTNVRADLASTTDVSKGAALVGHKPNYAWATGRELDQYRRYQSINLIEALPYNFVTDGSVDYSTQAQSILDEFLSRTYGGKLFIPALLGKVALGNLTVYSNTEIEGETQKITIIPASNNPIFKLAQDRSAVRVGFRNLILDGSATKGSHNNQDGILLQPGSGFFHDTVRLQNLTIQDCGNRGVAMIGGSDSLTFSQRVHLDQCHIKNCVGSGLKMSGYNLETSLINTFVTNNGSQIVDADSNVAMVLNGQRTQRVTWVGGGINAFGYTTGNAIYLQSPEQVSFIGVDIETAPTAVKIEHNLTRNITFNTCKFTTSKTFDVVFDVKDVDGLVVDNCGFGGTITKLYNLFVGNSRIKNVDIRPTNAYAGTITTKYTGPGASIIASGVATIVRSGFNKVDTEGAASTDDLDSILDESGGTIRFEHGSTITLARTTATREVTVKDGTGNLSLNGDFVLSNREDRLTLMWDSELAKWCEVSRSDNAV